MVDELNSNSVQTNQEQIRYSESLGDMLFVSSEVLGEVLGKVL